MIKFIILIIMFLTHIFADFHLQGILASIKQKSYWKNDPIGCQEKYKNDYKVALFIHSFEWTAFMMAPLYFLCIFNILIIKATSFIFLVISIVTFFGNILFHYFIDDLKCNDLFINLVTDQCLHTIQIIITWALFVFLLF